MTDDELIAFLGIEQESFRDRFIASVTPIQRQMFDRMREVELYDQGKGPCPPGVILCREHGPRGSKL